MAGLLFLRGQGDHHWHICPAALCSVRDGLAYAAFCGLEPQEGDREASSAQALLHKEELMQQSREMIPDPDN